MTRSAMRIDRRTLLRGAGVACALPWLEAMSHASPRRAAAPPKRLCYVYFPNGVSLPPASAPEHNDWSWFPLSEGADYQATRVLEPLEPHRDQLTIYGGLSHPNSRNVLGHLAGDTWLTGGDLRGSSYQNRVSVDQVAARTLGRDTRYRSLVLSTDGGIGYRSRIATLSFDNSGQPIPAEHRQRAIFERYFSPPSGSSTAERRKSLARGKKIVDLVLEDASTMRRLVGDADKQRLDEYLSAVNSVEEQIRRNEKWLDKTLVLPDGVEIDLNVAASVDPEGYLRAMFDLMVLAFQTDLTRVATFMMAREDGMGFGENFPKYAIGLKKGHHKISHDKSKGHWAEWGRYDQWLAKQFAYFLDRMRTVSDAHGPLLDRSLVLYGSSCSTTHAAVNYPLVLAGGSAMGVRHGGYRRAAEETPLANLFLSMLQTAGVSADRFSDSTGPLDGAMAWS